jgi:hypothetical protein
MGPIILFCKPSAICSTATKHSYRLNEEWNQISNTKHQHATTKFCVLQCVTPFLHAAIERNAFDYLLCKMATYQGQPPPPLNGNCDFLSSRQCTPSLFIFFHDVTIYCNISNSSNQSILHLTIGNAECRYYAYLIKVVSPIRKRSTDTPTPIPRR